MTKDKSKDRTKSFVRQAGILAIASIMVRVIGLLYKSPLYRILGAEGNGYYSTAYNIYTLVLLISSYSIPSAISKVMSQKLALGQYKNAQKIFKCSLIYVIIIGAVLSTLAFIFSPFLLDNENSIVVLDVFIPTIFFAGILAVLRGYFQARKDMTKTSVSQILEQIFNASFSIGMAYILMKTVGSIKNKKEFDTLVAIRGAQGSAIGTGVGVIVGSTYGVGVGSVYCFSKIVI